jgi:cation diffusion facilitator CzcD-associated flavoprotein CzcO
MVRALVVGAGAAGLGAAGALQRVTSDVTVLERSDAVGAS